MYRGCECENHGFRVYCSYGFGFRVSGGKSVCNTCWLLVGNEGVEKNSGHIV